MPDTLEATQQAYRIIKAIIEAEQSNKDEYLSPRPELRIFIGESDEPGVL